MTTQVATREERLERVRRALVHAETATGVRHVDWAGAAPPRPTGQEGRRTRPDPAAPGATVSGRAADGQVRAVPVGAATVVARFDGGWLAVPEALAPAVPHGAIRRGSTVSATGSATVLLHLVAALAVGGAWTAIVAQPDLGLAAAIDAGLDPARLVLIPDPGPGAAEVLGAVVDGFDVILVGETRALSDRDRRALSQRIRHRGAVLVSAQRWPGAEVDLSTVAWDWTGLGASGRLTGGRFVVAGGGRAVGATRTVTLTVTEHDGVTRLETASASRPVSGEATRATTATGAVPAGADGFAPGDLRRAG